MALQLVQTTAGHADDAAFRLWGQTIVNAIIACGITRVDETGHIDWTTVTRPAQGAFGGWEMFEFADSLQTAYPLKFKIEFGTTANGASGKALRITLGKTTDGAGTFNAPYSAAVTTQSGNVSGSALLQTIVCGDTNRILVFFECFGTVAEFGFSLERTKNANGTDSNFGVVLTCAQLVGASYGISQTVFSMASGTITTETALPGLVPSVGSGSIGSQTMAFAIFPAAGTFLNPLMNVFGMFSGNFTAGIPINITHYGATRKYMPISPTVLGLKFRSAEVTGALVRYE